jgi:glutaminyl-tRNA synthetase
MRRRGITPEAIKDFAERIGVAKSNSIVDRGLLEHCVREDLKLKAPRKMVVLDPLKVVITNYPEDSVEWMDDENNSDVEGAGSRLVPFSREIYIEREDFELDPPKKFHRLYIGNEVRLRKAYFITCNEAITDEDGNVIELRCTYDPETKSGSGFEGRKVKGTIHWVSAKHAVDATVRLYDNLVYREDENDDNSTLIFNPNSVVVLENCKLEPSFNDDIENSHFQFLRHGYFVKDSKLSKPEHLVFNRIVSLKSSYKG